MLSEAQRSALMAASSNVHDFAIRLERAVWDAATLAVEEEAARSPEAKPVTDRLVERFRRTRNGF